MNEITDGPIHFYTTYERVASLSAVVEYCVQIGERQPITRTQASYLVVSGKVQLDNKEIRNLATIIPHGTWQLGIREKNHHIVVHVTAQE